MNAELKENVLFDNIEEETKVTDTLDGKIESLYNKIDEYEKFSALKIENNSDKAKENQQKAIDDLKKSIEELQGKQMTAMKKMEQMKIMLDISAMKSELKLKEIEMEDVVEKAEDDYNTKVEKHLQHVEEKKNSLMEDATKCAEYVEKAIKGYNDDTIDGKPIDPFLSSLDDSWKGMRNNYISMIEHERKSIEILSLRMSELENQKVAIKSELERAQNEKNFIQEKMGLNIIDGEDEQLKTEAQKVSDTQKELHRIERESKKVMIQKDACKEKVDIIQTMIDGVISEFLAAQFEEANKKIPEFLSSVKYFDNIETL